MEENVVDGGPVAEVSQYIELQKFSPNACPNCGREFRREGADFKIVTDDSIVGDIVTTGHDTIACARCKEKFDRKLLSLVSAPTLGLARFVVMLEKGYTNPRRVPRYSFSDQVRFVDYTDPSKPRESLILI